MAPTLPMEPMGLHSPIAPQHTKEFQLEQTANSSSTRLLQLIPTPSSGPSPIGVQLTLFFFPQDGTTKLLQMG